MSDPGQFGLFLGLGMALATGLAVTLGGPIGQAIAQRLRGGKPEAREGLSTGEMTAERMAALEERIAELEGERVLLEERLDFAERMLTQGGVEQRSGRDAAQ